MNEQQKMKAKDYITSGILSLMNMVGMILSSVMNISGYTALFYGAVASFFVGILFVIVTCKVRSNTNIYHALSQSSVRESSLVC